MNARRVSVLAVMAFSVLCAASAWASKGVSLNGTWSTPLISNSQGVFDDGSPVYDNGLNGVQFYFGVSGNDVDLVTYNTSRTLNFIFDTTSPAWSASGLPANFNAVVDLYGVNYYGQYEAMGVGTTAQVNMTVQFKHNNLTYEINYQSIAVMRTGTSTWLFTSCPCDIPGNPGFTASDQGSLSVIKKHKQQTFGAVNMPIRFDVTIP